MGRFFKFNKNHFRPVIDSKREKTVADPSANKHVRVSACVDTCVKSRKEPLVRRYNTTDKREPKLAAMGMPGESQIYTVLHIDLK